MFKKFKQYISELPDRFFAILFLLLSCLTIALISIDCQKYQANTHSLYLTKKRANSYKHYERTLKNVNPINDLAPLNSTHKKVYVVVTDELIKKSIVNALNRWNDTYTVDFKYQIIKSRSKLAKKENKNCIYFKLYNKSSDNESHPTLAYTSQFHNREGLATGGEIKMNKTNLLNLYIYKDNFTSQKITNIAEHELGHMLGLQHRKDVESVMYPYDGKYSLQQVDVKDIKILYNEH